jgi:hypothetical protein
MNQTSEPKLARPGAGLPIPFRWVARFLIPHRASQSVWQENVDRFNRYSKSIDELAKSMTTGQLNTRFLVKPIMGLEDSSRYWSPAMLLDHLLIAGPGFHQIISELSQNRVPAIDVRTENLKPASHEYELDIVQKFSVFSSEFIPTLKIGANRLGARLKHPWFGPLNAHQWMYVLALHHGVHFQQLKQITASFKK